MQVFCVQLHTYISMSVGVGQVSYNIFVWVCGVRGVHGGWCVHNVFLLTN